MKIVVNGKVQAIEQANLLQYLEQLDRPLKGIAVCLNLDIIAKDKWHLTELKDGDSLEIVQAFAGG